jgi:hypothetical protein
LTGQFIIYGLMDPRTDELRYVGKSHSGMIRPRGHTYPSQLRQHNRRVAWLKALVHENLRPEIVVLEEAENAESLEPLEKQAIAHYREMGFDLVNGTDGGEGVSGRTVSEETRAKIRAARLGRTYSEETRARMAEAQRARFARGIPQEHRDSLSAAQKKRDPSTRRNAAKALAESNRKRTWTEESRERLSQSLKRIGHRPPPRSPQKEG